MIKKEKLSSLNTILIALLIVAGILCFGAYRLMSSVSGSAISKYYMSESADEKRSEKYLSSFRSYVSSNAVRSDDLEAIGHWTESEKYVRLIVYNSAGIPTIDASRTGAVSIDQSDERIHYSDPMYPVEFSDGTFSVSVSNYKAGAARRFADAASIVFAFIIFISILLAYNQRIIKDLRTLKNETNSVAEGNFDHTITIRGRGEITELAADIDKMRVGIIKGMEIEQSAIKANNDLITSISHDIRTPLTALIGYLDMIKAHQYDSRETLDEYVGASLQKAMQLKNLTDELFGYFLVFGERSNNMNIEEYDGHILLTQLMVEHVVILENSGFSVHISPSNEAFKIHIDAIYLKRVFDNLFNNIEKYADNSRSVIIMGTREGNYINVCLANYIPKTAVRRESTNIGLRTCDRILTDLGGKLVINRDGDKFSVEVILPAVFEENATE